MAELITHKLKTRLAVACWMIAACRSGAESMDVRDQSASQVKPAAAPAAAESDTLEPDREAAELPRGVSAPAPVPEDQRAQRLDTGERALRAESVEPARDAKLAHKTSSDGPQTIAMADATRLATPSGPKPSAPAPKAKPTVAKPPALAAPKPSAAKPPVVPPPRPSEAVQAEPPVPQEPIAAVPPPPAPKVSVTVPHTDHVHVDVPAGLQHWLDEDDRMKPWLGKAINVADACYAKVRQDDPSASGVISVSIIMHENARPSGSVSSVSGPINSIVMCATTRLLGVKMPLFTGTEGDSYTVRVRFEP